MTQAKPPPSGSCGSCGTCSICLQCTCDDCLEVRRPETIFSVVALILHKDGHVLAINRPGAPNDLAMIGGKIEPGESLFVALAREVREETGIVIDPSSLTVLYDRTDPSIDKVARCFFVERWTGTPEQKEPGLVPRWVTADEITAPGNTFGAWSRLALDRVGELRGMPYWVARGIRADQEAEEIEASLAQLVAQKSALQKRLATIRQGALRLACVAHLTVRGRLPLHFLWQACRGAQGCGPHLERVEVEEALAHLTVQGKVEEILPEGATEKVWAMRARIAS